MLSIIRKNTENFLLKNKCRFSTFRDPFGLYDPRYPIPTDKEIYEYNKGKKFKGTIGNKKKGVADNTTYDHIKVI